MAETRERILDAAKQVMRDQGLTRATTREIAAAAGVAEGTLYRHFPNREAIFLGVLLERAPSLVQLMASLPARVGHEPIADVLSAVATATLAFYREVSPLASALFAEAALLQQWRDHLRPLDLGPHVPLAALAGYLAAEQAAGRVASGADPAMISAMFFGACLQRAYFDALRGEAAAAAADAAFVAALVATVTDAFVRPAPPAT